MFLEDGSTYHLGTKKGEIAQRILTVGDVNRARRIAEKYLKDLKYTESVRAMHVFNGTYEGIPISIIAIGMGAPMMDFMMKEATACQEGEMAVIRIGTCGLFAGDLEPGSIVTATDGCVYSYIDYAVACGAIDEKENRKGDIYVVTKPIHGSKELDASIHEELKAMGEPVHGGVNAAGETFYACQGREVPGFDEGSPSKVVFDKFEKANVLFCEMEGHQLFYLASKRQKKTHVANVYVSILNRVKPRAPKINNDLQNQQVDKCASAALKSLVKCKLQ